MSGSNESQRSCGKKQEEMLMVLLSYSGFVSTIAGQPKVEGQSDGEGDQARFSAPSDLLLHRQTCSLLVADQGNRRMRSVRLPASSCATAGEQRKTWTEYLKSGFQALLFLSALPRSFNKLKNKDNRTLSESRCFEHQEISCFNNSSTSKRVASVP
jgi:hypothetical protein